MISVMSLVFVISDFSDFCNFWVSDVFFSLICDVLDFCVFWISGTDFCDFCFQ